MDKREESITKALTMAGALFENYTPSADKVRALSVFFRDVDTRQFLDALGMTLREPGRKFFPTPGEIQESLNKLKADKKLTSAQIFGQLRAFVRRGMTEKQAYQRLRSTGDAAGLQALRIITYDAIRDTPSHEMHFLERRFTSAYRDVETLSTEREAVTLIEGRSQRFNQIAAGCVEKIGRVA